MLYWHFLWKNFRYAHLTSHFLSKNNEIKPSMTKLLLIWSMDDNKVVWEVVAWCGVVHHPPVPAIRDVIISHNHQNYYSHYPTAITTLSLHDLYQYSLRWTQKQICYKYWKRKSQIEQRFWKNSWIEQFNFGKREGSVIFMCFVLQYI